VVRFLLADPSDVSGLEHEIRDGGVDPGQIVAVIGKTHGNGPAERASEAALLKDFSAFSSVASCSAGVEVRVYEVVVVGKSATSDPDRSPSLMRPWRTLSMSLGSRACFVTWVSWRRDSFRRATPSGFAPSPSNARPPETVSCAANLTRC
jgi:hypothetical protein